MDLKSNQNGAYLKISERNGNNRNSILIPASGIKRLADVMQEIVQSAELHQVTQHYAHDKGVRYNNQLFDKFLFRIALYEPKETVTWR